jgi:hypothetical protein
LLRQIVALQWPPDKGGGQPCFGELKIAPGLPMILHV